MKKILPFLTLLILFSCAPEEDAPGITPTPGAPEPNTTLSAVLGLHYQDLEKVYTFEKPWIVEAYVVSSDEAGNFYKELVVQERPENPQAGLNIKLNMNVSYQFYNFGRKIYINLEGLSVGEANGVPTLGVANGNQIEDIPQSRVSAHLIRTTEVAQIVPLVIDASQFDDRLENLYVQLNDVQFNKLLVSELHHATFAAEENDEFDGERLVESCAADFPFVLSTSTYADFNALTLPDGSGSITGILTRDFYDEFYTVYVNSPLDVNFDSSSRCDPEVFTCGLAATEGAKILFEDDFSTQKNNKPVEGKGWKNIIQEGSKQWEAYTATGANASLGKSVRIRTAGSGDVRSITWLITPKINFEKQEGEVLTFKTSTSFANASFLEVLLSTTWDGKEENLPAADWKILSAATIAQNNDFFGDWISSGKIDLSCVESSGYIAFRYTGSDHSYYDGVYELDEVRISAAP